jgi:hypothetical protein
MDIDSFIKKYGIELVNNEPEGFRKIMKDSHICISWKNIRYYLPKEYKFYTKEDYELIELLKKYSILL